MAADQPAADPLTSDEQQVFQAANVLELETGFPPSAVELASETGLAAARVHVVLSQLTGDLGLLREEPGDSAEGPVYRVTGRGSAEAASAEREVIAGDLPAQLEGLLDGIAFPAGKDALVPVAVNRRAPRALELALRRLPDGARYRNLQDLIDAVQAELA